ncbi:MAG: hypothetical protein J6M40_02420 [Prevotella sp.]|nr:hypothetical protein [Prevotella sp.]
MHILLAGTLEMSWDGQNHLGSSLIFLSEVSGEPIETIRTIETMDTIEAMDTIDAIETTAIMRFLKNTPLPTTFFSRNGHFLVFFSYLCSRKPKHFNKDYGRLPGGQ